MHKLEFRESFYVILLWCALLKIISIYYFKIDFFDNDSTDPKLLRYINEEFSSFIYSLIIFGTGFMLMWVVSIIGSIKQESLMYLYFILVPIIYSLRVPINIMMNSENILDHRSTFTWTKISEFLDDKMFYNKLILVPIVIFLVIVTLLENRKKQTLS
jgi:hypothetical protein